MKSETHFLRNVRKNLGISETTQRGLSKQSELLQSVFSGAEEVGKAELLTTLAASCKRHNLSLHLAEDAQEAAQIILQLVVAESPEFSTEKHVMIHNHPLLQQLELEGDLEREGIGFTRCSENDPKARQQHQQSSVGITAPGCVVASHGTIIQQTGEGQPRSTSLLPSHHIAVAREKRLVATLEQGFKRMQEMGPNVVLISGPSKTADVEGILIEGVHGPGEQICCLID